MRKLFHAACLFVLLLPTACAPTPVIATTPASVVSTQDAVKVYKRVADSVFIVESSYNEGKTWDFRASIFSVVYKNQLRFVSARHVFIVEVSPSTLFRLRYKNTTYPYYIV